MAKDGNNASASIEKMDKSSCRSGSFSSLMFDCWIDQSISSVESQLIGYSLFLIIGVKMTERRLEVLAIGPSLALHMGLVGGMEVYFL